jgi:hypothetical protein
MPVYSGRWATLIRESQRFVQPLTCTFRQTGLRQIIYQLDRLAKGIDDHAAVVTIFQMVFDFHAQRLRGFAV